MYLVSTFCLPESKIGIVIKIGNAICLFYKRNKKIIICQQVTIVCLFRFFHEIMFFYIFYQVQDIEFTQIELKVIEGLKVGNDCLKSMHEVSYTFTFVMSSSNTMLSRKTINYT